VKKPSKPVLFAFILYCLLIVILSIAKIAEKDFFYFDFYKGFWPFGTGFNLLEWTLEEAVIYILLPIGIYWLWYKLDDYYK